MTEKEKEIGANLTKKLNFIIFILAFLWAFACYYESKRVPTTAELEPSSILYNQELAEKYYKTNPDIK